MNFWEVFDAAATRFPDRIAIEVQRRGSVERLTYAELHDAAVTRAAWLKARGISPGDRCAILADNDAAWCGAYLGILCAGAVAVPLDTNYSASQVHTIVADSGARIVFVNERLKPIARDALSTLADTIVADLTAPVAPARTEPNVPAASASARGELHASYGETSPKRPEGREGGPRAPEHRTASIAPASPNAPAVILYTSGTTADPKGVVLSHGNLIAERDAAFKVVSVSEQDSVLGVLPLFHALAQLANLLLPFAVGARVVFLETLSSSELLRALSERDITIFACVPQFFYLIHERVMQEVERAGLVKRLLFGRMLALNFTTRRVGINLGPLLFARIHKLLGTRMRLFITGGSKFDPAIGRDFYALGFTILQAYGLTETTGAATITRPDEAHLDTVGRPLPGQEIRILSASDADLDGEIAVRGPIVMQGYFNRPDATRDTMADGWFLTGDLGKLDRHGRLAITGRKKEVIVLSSGKNIYPEEIEAQYRQSTFIKEICVVGLTREDEPTAERLFAVVVPDPDRLREKRIVNAGDLLRFEMEGQSIHLPPHKRVLGYQVWFDPLPRTTTGKLKRHEIERRLRGAERGARATTIEESAWADDPHALAAATIIQARAPGRAVQPSANLELDLGLDSMERVELLTELEQRFGVRVDTSRAHEIFTVAHLIEAVRPGEGNRGTTPSEPSWAILLKDARSSAEPAVQGLLQRRPLAAPIFFAVSRLIRLILRPSVTGRLEHLPPNGPYIISPNHQGYIDPFILCAVLPYRIFHDMFFVGAAEYFETRLTKWLARKINLLPVDPDANLVSAMKASAFGLHHGKILVLFPEGERSIDGTVKRFKKGAPILAQHLAVPIVPVAIKGSFEIWPRNRSFNWKVLVPFSGHRVRVAFGPPLQFAADADYGQSANHLREVVASMWSDL